MKPFRTFEYPILAGIVGFIFSIILLTAHCGEKNPIAFQEIQVLGARDTIINILSTKRLYLDSVISILIKDSAERGFCKEETECAVEQKQVEFQLNQLRSVRENTANSLYLFKHNNADTANVFYANYLTVDARELRSKIENFKDDTSIQVFMKDTSFSGEQSLYNRLLLLRKSTDSRIMDFVSRNPVLGFWLILSIGQMSLWFLLSFLLPGNLLMLHSGLKSGNELGLKDIWLSFITPVIGIGVFVSFFYYRLIDEYLFPNEAILQGFGQRMFWYSVPGYLVAAICFGLFIYSAGKLKDVHVGVKDAKTKDITKLSLNQKDLDQLTKLCNAAFLATAAVLSIFILWLGFLFTGINHMEIMQYSQRVSNKPFLNGDFVYMVALMHTILLIIFYLPVKLQINSLEIVKADHEEGKESAFKVWPKNILETLGVILATTSPLIASFVEKAISSFL